MTETAPAQGRPHQRVMLSKVPEVTIWFWIIKILCTTVGESFADWINVGLGVGLNNTAILFTVVLAIVLGAQMTLNRYLPVVYWLTVVVLSVAGTLYTDILTDALGVPLAVSTTVFAVILAAVFGLWYAKEHTLSIHSIITVPREAFYWLAVLVTFALGTAVGDWTLQLTGWGLGISVLLPASLIVSVIIGWRLGANAVLSFWLAYILTRPLGANLGDWFASASTDGGLGLGYGITSVIFLAAILAAVIYLTISRADVIDSAPRAYSQADTASRPTRERVMLGYFAGVAAITGALLVWAAGQPHPAAGNASEAEGGAQPVVTGTLTPGQASATFPPADIATFRMITQDTFNKVRAGDQAGATTRVTDLETAWDNAQSTLKPMDEPAWSILDSNIDAVLRALRSSSPDQQTEKHALNTILSNLR